MEIRDRVKGLQRVRAGDLLPHPKNWRTHPPHQRDALRGVLEEIGFAGAVIARQLDNGKLQLIDGHLRAESNPDQKVPVLVVDLDEGEADKLLAVHDPLASMAGTDQTVLEELLATVHTDNEALAAMLGDMLHPAESKVATEPDGETLARLQIGGYAPRHTVANGEVWKVCDRHLVVCASVVNDWPTWSPLLAGLGTEAMLAPYAGPLALLSAAARVRRVCIVQPVAYVAGVILDWAEDAFGKDALVQQRGGSA
jgi:hypothetical protein